MTGPEQLHCYFAVGIIQQLGQFRWSFFFTLGTHDRLEIADALLELMNPLAQLCARRSSAAG